MAVKGKWARGIPPRFFAWIIKDKLAVSERPGGYARNHRRIRRQEEILWLRGEGFTRVVSLLPSPHNLHAYDELDLAWAHMPYGTHDDPEQVLPDIYSQLREWMGRGEQLLVHQEELNDRLMGVVAGYLRWSGLVPAGPQAITVVERILQRQMGPDGRELVALAPQLAGAGGNGTLVGVRTRATVSVPRTARPVGVPKGPAFGAAGIGSPASATAVDAGEPPEASTVGDGEVALTPAEVFLTPAEVALTPAEVALTPAEVALTPAEVALTPAEVPVAEATASVGSAGDLAGTVEVGDGAPSPLGAPGDPQPFSPTLVAAEPAPGDPVGVSAGGPATGADERQPG